MDDKLNEALHRLAITSTSEQSNTLAATIRAHIEALQAKISDLSQSDAGFIWHEKWQQAANGAAKLMDSLAAAEASVRELEGDAARLDYIERTFSGMTNRERYLPVQMIWGKGCNGRTLREACDKYMKRAAIDSAMQGEEVRGG